MLRIARMKVERFGVSMNGELLAVIDSHLSETREDRSAYLRRLAEADLAAAGKLPNTPRSVIRDLAIAVAEIAGEASVIAALTAVRASASQSARAKALVETAQLKTA